MKYFFLLISCLAASIKALPQGCSDAGFCSLSILKNHVQNTSKQSLSIGFNYGNGQGNTDSYTAYLEYKRQLNKHIAVHAKITGGYAVGFLGSNINAGDVFAFATYSTQPQAANKLTFLGGVKIPLTTANDKNNNGKPLPLDYQPGIGTYDLIAGANYIFQGNWELNAGVQLPIVQINKNSFFPSEYIDSRINDFVASNLFLRKSDILARVGYYARFKKSNITIKPNILAVYHVGKDSYENIYGKRTIIDGSQGITINGGIVATKTFANGHQLEFIAATPFVVRDKRPDGLTRSAVFNFQYSISF